MTHNISSYNLDTIQESLTSIAIAQDTEIWILNNQNEIIVNTDKTASNFPAPVKSFDPTAWGGSYYQIGDFYGFFSSPRLSVIAPITADMSTKGYVAIHYQMRFLYQNRSGLLKIMQILFLCIYLTTLLLLLLYHWHVQRPLSQIIRGTTEFAGGNLSYKIPVTSDESEWGIPATFYCQHLPRFPLSSYIYQRLCGSYAGWDHPGGNAGQILKYHFF